MLQIYYSRRGPQPLGTVVFEEIEAKAHKKLKDQGSEGAFAVISLFFFLKKIESFILINRRFLVRWWKCWYKFHLSL